MLSGITLAACSYGPPQLRVSIANYLSTPAGDTTVVAVASGRWREPRGLAAFPDGGAPKISDEQGLFYLCVRSGGPAPAIRRLAVLRKPDTILSGFSPWILGRTGDGIIAKLTGHLGRTSDTPLQTFWYRIAPQGGAVEIQAPPVPRLASKTSIDPECERGVLRDAAQQLAP